MLNIFMKQKHLCIGSYINYTVKKKKKSECGTQVLVRPWEKQIKTLTHL